MSYLTVSDFANQNNQTIQSKIEQIRLEIEHLKLENERLRLFNENIILRSQSQDRVDIPAVEEPEILPSVEEEPEEEELDNYNDINYDLTYSEITSCTIMPNKTKIEVEGKELNYTRIARKIWELTPRQTIYDNSTFNSKDYYCSKHGYKWIYEIQLSIQIGNTKEILDEILHMCKLMKIELKMTIELQNGYKIKINVTKKENGSMVVSHKTTQVKQVLKNDRVLYSTNCGWYY